MRSVALTQSPAEENELPPGSSERFAIKAKGWNADLLFFLSKITLIRPGLMGHREVHVRESACLFLSHTLSSGFGFGRASVSLLRHEPRRSLTPTFHLNAKEGTRVWSTHLVAFQRVHLPDVVLHQL